MKQREVLETHPRKVRVADIPRATELRAEDGWVDFAPQFLITRETVGSDTTVFGIAVFPPGAKHDIHRHPKAEETEYIIEGSGIARVGDDDVALGAGEIVFVPRNEWHGFHNTSTTERAVMVWCYAGAASLAEAGYITEKDVYLDRS
jgi:quercetin dioxygenase-like cupin family protein